MPFNQKQKILFKHCDPAGIVFYPRYFEIVNDTIENYFFEVLDMPFENLHAHGAVPAVDIHAQFHAPSRHGDMLDISLHPTRIGGASIDFYLDAKCVDQPRMSVHITIVNVGLNGKSKKWENKMIDKVESLLTSSEISLLV